MSATADIGSRLDNLDKKFEQFAQTVEKGFSTVHHDFDRGASSYFENDFEDGEDIRKAALGWNLPRTRKGNFKLPKGYKKQFNSMSDMLRTMCRNEKDFAKRHGEAVEFLKAALPMSNTDSDSAGSLVLPEFAPQITETLYQNAILSMCDQYTVAGHGMKFPKLDESSRADGIRHGGVRGYWVEEAGAMTDSRPSYNMTELRLKKLAVVVYLTNELIDDNSYALEQHIRKVVAREINFLVGNAIVNGTGGGMPLGFLNAQNLVTIAAESGQSAATIVAMNILKMYSRRRSDVPLSGYRWMYNQNVEPQLMSTTLGTAGSQLVTYLPPGGLSGSPYASLMGLPMMATEFNPVLGAVGDLCLVNLPNYVTITKGGVNEMASPHVEFLRDITALKFTFRIDGRPMWDTAITPYKSNGSDQQSDFIAIAAR